MIEIKNNETYILIIWLYCGFEEAKMSNTG